MIYESRKKKISSFTVDDALTDSSTFDFIKNGINKKTSWGNILDKFSEVYGLGARIFETQADLVASDIQIDEHAIVVSNNYGLYKITSLAAGAQDVTLTSGFVATLQNALDVPAPADYTELRAIETAGLLDGTPITVTDSGIGGEGVLRNVVAHGLTDNGGTIIVINADFYWVRSYSGDVNVKWFGATGDGVTLDTVAVQNALNFAATNATVLRFPAGTYLCDNLTIPSGERYACKGEGQYQSFLKASATVADTDYFIASSSYLSNSIFGNEPVYFRDISFDGNGVVDNVFVLKGYFSEFTSCRFTNPVATTGTAFLMTANGQDGTPNSGSSLVENKLIGCRFIGNSGFPFKQTDTSGRLTDAMVTNCFFLNGEAQFVYLAGWNISNNHFYSGEASFSSLSTGTIINGNYFENVVTLNNFIEQLVTLCNNVFINILDVKFGNNGKVCVLEGNNFQSGGYPLHDFFGADKHLIVNGGGVEGATMYAFHNGGSTGRISFNRVFSYAAGYFYDGSRTGPSGAINRVLNLPAAPVSGTFSIGDTVLNTTASVDANNMIILGWKCTVAGTPGTWLPMYVSTVSPAT